MQQYILKQNIEFHLEFLKYFYFLNSNVLFEEAKLYDV